MTGWSVARSNIDFSPFAVVGDMWSVSTAEYVSFSGVDSFARYKGAA